MVKHNTARKIDTGRDVDFTMVAPSQWRCRIDNRRKSDTERAQGNDDYLRTCAHKGGRPLAAPTVLADILPQ